jgi:hypothetical protein
MTTETISRSPVGVTWSGRSAPLLTLGRREAKRMLKSPVYIILAALILLSAGVDSFGGGFPGSMPSAAAVYEGLLYFLALYAGLLTYIAVHLVASSSRRTHADRQLAASAMSPRARLGGLCLGVAFGPFAVALGAVAVMAWLGRSVAGTDESSFLAEGAFMPWSVIELLQVALTVAGAGLFAIMVATWLRFPGSLPIGFVALLFGTLFVLDRESLVIPWFAPYTTAPDWMDDPWALMGSQAWHAAYLVGLCALAVCGAMLRERDGRRRWLAISAGVFAATALVGWLQLS